MIASQQLKQSGFTLPELLVVIAVCSVLALGGYFFVHPDNNEAEFAEAERRLGVAFIIQSLNRYYAEQGNLPDDIPEKPTFIGSASGNYDLCEQLVPRYAVDLPLDPKYGFHTQEDICNSDGQQYFTAYQISKSGDIVTVSAPKTEAGKLSISRKY